MELDMLLAENVMGWHLEKLPITIAGKRDIYDVWIDEHGNRRVMDIDWHPTTNADQAKLCLETWKKQKDSRFIRITLTVSGWAVYLEENNHLKGNAHGEFEYASCYALYQATKGSK